MYNRFGDFMSKKTTKNSEVEKKIIDILNHLKPFLISDGGNVEFIKYEDNIVYISLGGACAECQMLDLTLKDGIEATIMEEIPEVKAVVNISSTEAYYGDIF